MITSSIKVVKITILGNKVIFDHLAIFIEVVVTKVFMVCIIKILATCHTTAIVFIEIVAITINSNDFVFSLSTVFVEVEVKAINGLSTSDGFAIFSEVIPVVVIIFDKLVAFVRFWKNCCQMPLCISIVGLTIDSDRGIGYLTSIVFIIVERLSIFSDNLPFGLLSILVKIKVEMVNVLGTCQIFSILKIVPVAFRITLELTARNDSSFNRFWCLTVYVSSCASCF